MKKTAVVILNWNGKRFLEKFLPGVLENSRDTATVIVADNASDDGSLEFMATHFPEVRVIRNDRNYGFAEGYNRALAHVEAKYYVLLNSDIEVTPGWIAPVVECMEKDDRIAACQPKVLSYHNKKHFEYAGASGGFIDKYGYPFCRGRLFLALEEDRGQYDTERDVFWATGACLFVRADLYREHGGLDGDFFAHMEEIDFCWRMKNLGYRIRVCPSSTVYHVGGGTLPKSSARKTYLNFRNNMSLLYKNLPSHRLIKVFVARFFLDIIASGKFLLEGHFSDFIAVIRAYISFYGSAGKQRKKRKALDQKKATEIYRGNIALEYFIRRKKRFTQLNPGKFS